MNNTVTAIWESSYLKTVLDDFSKLAHNKKYKYVDYANWKILMKFALQNSDKVRIYLYKEKNQIKIQIPGSYVELSTIGNSLGEYICSAYFSEVTKMNNNAITGTTFATTSNNIGVTDGTSTTPIFNGYAYSNNLNTYPAIPMNDFQKIEDKFAEIGVFLKDANGNLRSIMDITHDVCEVYEYNMKDKKENTKMKGFNFDFGPCTGDAVRMSPYGIAVKNSAGVWVSYNPADGNIIDVDVFNFDGAKYMFKMPAAIKDIAVGDIIIHNRVPMFVTDISAEMKITAVDVRAGEEKCVIPTTNMFGFNFVTKIVSMFNALGKAPTADAPFGNMLPFLMMGDSGEDFDPMLMFMMMQGNGGSDMFSNPMMMYFMMKNDDHKDMLPLMIMMNMNK